MTLTCECPCYVLLCVSRMLILTASLRAAMTELCLREDTARCPAMTPGRASPMQVSIQHLQAHTHAQKLTYTLVVGDKFYLKIYLTMGKKKILSK